MAQKESTWERLKAFLKDNISLVNIIAAALLVELVSGVMYYSAHNLLLNNETLSLNNGGLSSLK